MFTRTDSQPKPGQWCRAQGPSDKAHCVILAEYQQDRSVLNVLRLDSNTLPLSSRLTPKMMMMMMKRGFI